jgi:Family of unknown function (DUF6263)
MKKTILSALAIAFTLGLSAQSYTPAVKLNAGKKYTITSTTKGNMSQEVMGQTMEIPIDGVNTATLTVKAATDKGYDAAFVTDRIQFSMNAMGQEVNYDSDKKEDREGKMGDQMNKLVGAETTFTVDASGNIIKETIVKPKEEKKADDGPDMMASMMSNMGMNSASTCPAFNLFVTNKEIKIGDSFVDSSTVSDKDGKTKSSTTYVLKEVKDGKATFTLSGQIAVEKKMEMQGMEMSTTTNSKSSGDMLVDSATGLLISKSIVIETTGNVEVQGMTIPITGKTTSTIVVAAK